MGLEYCIYFTSLPNESKSTLNNIGIVNRKGLQASPDFSLHRRSSWCICSLVIPTNKRDWCQDKSRTDNRAQSTRRSSISRVQHQPPSLSFASPDYFGINHSLDALFIQKLPHLVIANPLAVSPSSSSACAPPRSTYICKRDFKPWGS